MNNKISGLLLITGVLILLLLFLLSGIDFIDLLIRVNQWFYDKIGLFGIYIATLLISILGTFTIMIPVPYILGIITALLILPVNPLLLALASAIGSTIGEFSSWLVGRGTGELINKKAYMNKIKGLSELIKKGYGSWLVFFYALTPLPDDILLIALGMEKYPLKKTIIPGFIGKFLMICTLILVIFLAKNTIIGQGILSIYGLETTNGSVKSTENPLTSTIIMIVTIAITLLIISIDWDKFIKRIKNRLIGTNKKTKKL